MANLEHVNKDDQVIGIVPYEELQVNKLVARISRVFLFDNAGRLYLQRRALSMSSSPGVWDQSAAGHVDIGETYEVAAARELEEELGVKNVILNFLVKYYGEESSQKYGLLKRFNALFIAHYDGQEIVLDPDEVMDGKWVTITELEEWIDKNPEEFSSGFITAYKKYNEVK